MDRSKIQEKGKKASDGCGQFPIYLSNNFMSR